LSNGLFYVTAANEGKRNGRQLQEEAISGEARPFRSFQAGLRPPETPPKKFEFDSLNPKPRMLPEQTPWGSGLARLGFQARGKEVNDCAIQRFGSDHRRLLDVDLQKMKKQAVTAQVFPLFDRELGDELLI